MRRFSSALTRSAARGGPGGIPSGTPTRPRRWDSPAVVKRTVTLTRGSSRDSALPLKRRCARLRADAEPRVHSRSSRGDSRLLALPDNSTRARLRAGLVISLFVHLSTPWRGGQGVRTHRGDGITG